MNDQECGIRSQTNDDTRSSAHRGVLPGRTRETAVGRVGRPQWVGGIEQTTTVES